MSLVSSKHLAKISTSPYLMPSSIMALTPGATTETANSFSFNINNFRNLKKTLPEYRDSFGSPAFKQGIWNAWNVTDEASRRWSTLKPQLDELLSIKRSHIRPPRVYRGPKDPLWFLRCYMIGLSKEYATPHVAVVCSQNWFSKGARAVILQSRLLENVGWKGCIGLVAGTQQPGGDSSPRVLWHSQRAIPDNFEVFSDTGKLPLSLCGSKIDVVMADVLHSVGTIGGVVQVADDYYGMTVGHIFQRTAFDNFNLDPYFEMSTLTLDEAELDAHGTDDVQDMLAETWSTLCLSQADYNLEMTGLEAQHTVETSLTQPAFDHRSTVKLGVLEEYSRVISESIDGRLNLDWAVVTIEHIQLCKPNIVVMPSDMRLADILSQSVAESMPESPIQVCLATARGPLIGENISSLSTVKMSYSERHQTTWTLKIDKIEAGDCGAWAFDTETGDLLGMLIATCAVLSEAYILPAKEIIDDIRKMSGKDVKLPTQKAVSTGLNQRMLNETNELNMQGMETRKRVLGEEHPDTLTSMANLASTYSNQGRWKEAEELEVQVIETRKRVLGQEHPDTLISMANLASTFLDQGRLKEAEKLEVQVMETMQRVLGQEHPDTLTSMGQLASTYRNQGRWKEAEKLEVQVMETMQRVLGQEHLDTLTSMGQLASTYRNQGRWKEAEELEVQVMETRKRVLGEEHPDTLTSMGNLASTYRHQGRWKEAEGLLVQVMKTMQRVLGEEHPDTLNSMANLAATFLDQGRLKEAEELGVQVMETRKRVLGEEHPNTLTSMANLASTFLDQGRLKEAEELGMQVMETRKRVLGEEHPNTLTSMANLASTFLDQDRLKEAEGLFMQVMKTMQRVLGQEHPNTLISMANLASTYRHQRRWKEAEKLEVQVMETRKRVLGEEHPDTLTSMGNLAFT
jgi:tetratricopeptide (TPR) repeat protein